MRLIKNIPLLTPCLPNAGKLLPFLKQIDDSNWYTNFGPMYDTFQAQLSNHFPERYLTLTNNGTSALEIAISNIGLSKHAKILVPALTFPATVTAIIRMGFTPVIADVDSDNWQLTPEIAEDALKTNNCEAIIPVATFGVPVDASTWDKLRLKHDVKVIIDAAGAFGNQQCPKHCLTVFSLHATKTLTAGEGGIIVSGSKDQQAAFTKATNFGITEDTMVYDGDNVTNAKLTEYHAAVGLASLEDWPDSSQNRIKLLSDYQTILKQYHLPVSLQNNLNNCILSLLSLRFPREVDIQELKQYLQNKGIQTKQWYCPIIPQHPAFNQLKVASDLTNAKQIAQSILGLPFHLQLDQSDIERIAQTVADFCRKSVSASTKLVS